MGRSGLIAFTVAVIASASILAACGDNDETVDSLPPIATTSTTTTIPATTTTIQSTYEVQPNDTLFKIAQKFGLTMDAILLANPKITNPDKIDAGTVLQLPQPGQPPPTTAATTTTPAPASPTSTAGRR